MRFWTGYNLVTMNDTERRIAVLRIDIARYTKRLETVDGADYATTKAYLKRDEAELATLLTKVAA